MNIILFKLLITFLLINNHFLEVNNERFLLRVHSELESTFQRPQSNLQQEKKPKRLIIAYECIPIVKLRTYEKYYTIIELLKY